MDIHGCACICMDIYRCLWISMSFMHIIHVITDSSLFCFDLARGLKTAYRSDCLEIRVCLVFGGCRPRRRARPRASNRPLAHRIIPIQGRGRRQDTSCVRPTLLKPMQAVFLEQTERFAYIRFHLRPQLIR